MYKDSVLGFTPVAICHTLLLQIGPRVVQSIVACNLLQGTAPECNSLWQQCSALYTIIQEYSKHLGRLAVLWYGVPYIAVKIMLNTPWYVTLEGCSPHHVNLLLHHAVFIFHSINNNNLHLYNNFNAIKCFQTAQRRITRQNVF